MSAGSDLLLHYHISSFTGLFLNHLTHFYHNFKQILIKLSWSFFNVNARKIFVSIFIIRQTFQQVEKYWVVTTSLKKQAFS